MQTLKDLPVRMTKHTVKRLRERFGLDKNAALRFSNNVVKKGHIVYSIDKNIKISKDGHSYIFVKSFDSKSNEDVLLMITALNEDKSREWNQYYHGEKRKASTIKASKINKNHPIAKNRDLKRDFLYEEICA